MSIGEGRVIETGEGRAISYKNKLVYILKQKIEIFSNSLKAFINIKEKEEILKFREI